MARAEARKIYKLLEQPIETKDFPPAGMSLKEFIGWVGESFDKKGLQVPIIVDAFVAVQE